MKNGYASVSDEDLLAALRDDDDRAFAELYRRYARLLVATAFRKTSGQASTEDLSTLPQPTAIRKTTGTCCGTPMCC